MVVARHSRGATFVQYAPAIAVVRARIDPVVRVSVAAVAVKICHVAPERAVLTLAPIILIDLAHASRCQQVQHLLQRGVEFIRAVFVS